MGIEKYRVHEVAKDFGLPTKTITEILTKYAETPKNHMQALTDQELSLIFEYLTQHNPVSSIQVIFADTYKDEPAKEPAAKKAEPAGKAAAPAQGQQALLLLLQRGGLHSRVIEGSLGQPRESEQDAASTEVHELHLTGVAGFEAHGQPGRDGQAHAPGRLPVEGQCGVDLEEVVVGTDLDGTVTGVGDPQRGGTTPRVELDGRRGTRCGAVAGGGSGHGGSPA